MEETLNATTRIPEDPSVELMKQKSVNKIDYELLSDRRVPFTRELAEKFIEMATFVGERALYDEHLDYMLRVAKEGKFLGDITCLASCVCKWDGKERRLNGQHCSWMRTYMPEDWEPVVHVLRYSVSREDDFRALYTSFDRILRRSSRHVVVAEIFGTTEFERVSAGNLGHMASAVRLWTHEHSSDKRRIDDIVELMKGKHHKLVLEVGAFLEGIMPSNAPHMFRRASVTAAMLATFNKSVQDSLKFWQQVRDGGGNASDPSLMLMKYLIKNSVKASATSRENLHVSREGLYRICISCWNAFRKGAQLKALRISDNRAAAR